MRSTILAAVFPTPRLAATLPLAAALLAAALLAAAPAAGQGKEGPRDTRQSETGPSQIGPSQIGPSQIGTTGDAEIVFWQSIGDGASALDYRAYLDTYPDGAFAALAQARLKALGDAASPDDKAAGEPGAAEAAPGPATYDDVRAALEVGDYDLAVAALRPAAEGGDTLAQTLLAVIYSRDIGPAGNLVVARAWLERAAEAGSADAMVWLGHMYKNQSIAFGGTGEIGEMYPEAVAWYERAAEAGAPAGMYWLGVVNRLHVLSGFLEITTPEEEDEAARRWFGEAGDLGYAPALYQQAAALRRDGDGDGDDAAIATALERAAAAGPDGIDAQAQLGMGLGKVDDPVRQYYWLLVARTSWRLTGQPRVTILGTTSSEATGAALAEGVWQAGAVLTEAQRDAARREAEALTAAWTPALPAATLPPAD